MGQEGPPGAKIMTFLKIDIGPHRMTKEVFSAPFELVVARFGPPEIPNCLGNGLIWDRKCDRKCDRKWVKNGSNMCFSENDPKPFGVPKQMK